MIAIFLAASTIGPGLSSLRAASLCSLSAAAYIIINHVKVVVYIMCHKIIMDNISIHVLYYYPYFKFYDTLFKLISSRLQ